MAGTSVLIATSLWQLFKDSMCTSKTPMDVARPGKEGLIPCWCVNMTLKIQMTNCAMMNWKLGGPCITRREQARTFGII